MLKKLDIEVRPSPATHSITVSFEADKFENWLISDAKGVPLATGQIQTGVNSFSLDISRFTEGWYAISLQGAKFYGNKAFIKMN